MARDGDDLVREKRPVGTVADEIADDMCAPDLPPADAIERPTGDARRGDHADRLPTSISIFFAAALSNASTTRSQSPNSVRQFVASMRDNGVDLDNRMRLQVLAQRFDLRAADLVVRK